jgi:hypothetical protein
MEFRLVNKLFRLDKNVNKAFQPAMCSLLVYPTTIKNPPESTNGKPRFRLKSKMADKFKMSNIQMDLNMELHNIETHLRCHFQLTLGYQFVWWYFWGGYRSRLWVSQDQHQIWPKFDPENCQNGVYQPRNAFEVSFPTATSEVHLLRAYWLKNTKIWWKLSQI